MTKFRPEDLTWVAIHDKKIVKHPDYIDIDRSTLKELQLRNKDEVVFSMKNPKKLFIRLRSYDIKPQSQAGKKCWIVGNSSPLEYYIIDGESTKKYDSWGDIPRHCITLREDEK